MSLPYTNLLLAPVTDTKGAGSVMSPELSKDEILDFLNSDEDDEKETIDLEADGKRDSKESKEDGEAKKDTREDSKDGEDSEGEEDDELKAIEEELEEPDEEQLELTTPVSRREILKAYPDLFKKFPFLEKSYFRERAYTEILPTIDDAKEAVEKAQALDRFEKDLSEGNLEVALKVIKNESPKAFNQVVDNYLETLGNIDQKAYHHVVGNIIKHTIISMLGEAKESDNEALQSAAQILNQFAFGSSKFTAPTRLSGDAKESKEDNTEAEKLKQERAEFAKQRFETARDGLNTKVNNSIKATLDANMDPKDSMGPYVKKAACNDAYDTLIKLIGQDARFKALNDKLWERAFANNFNDESLAAIRSAFLSKVKPLLPSVIKKARNEALRGIGKRVRNDDDSNDESNDNKGSTGTPKLRHSTSPVRSGKINSAKDIPKGMTSLEFLNSD